MKKKLISALAFTFAMAMTITAHATPVQMENGDIFDADYYAATNPDVVAALGIDAEALYNHYLLCGKAEGRPGYDTAATGSNIIETEGYILALKDSLPLTVTSKDGKRSAIVNSLTFTDKKLSEGVYRLNYELTFSSLSENVFPYNRQYVDLNFYDAEGVFRGRTMVMLNGATENIAKGIVYNYNLTPGAYVVEIVPH